MGGSLTWKVVRASVIGSSHERAGQPCQDSCFADIVRDSNGDDCLVAITADGAGSALHGGEGAELACETAFTAIAEWFERHDSACLAEAEVIEWVKVVRRALYSRAEEEGLTARDFACTLLGTILGPRRAAFFQVGDGAIVASSRVVQGVVFWPDSGEYANMTYFVTDEEAFDHLQVSIATVSFEEVALFSDGLQRLALSYADHLPHTPFFEPMLSVLRKHPPESCEQLDGLLVKFLASAGVNERTDDDKTLVLATRRDA